MQILNFTWNEFESKLLHIIFKNQELGKESNAKFWFVTNITNDTYTNKLDWINFMLEEQFIGP
jgi:hypothetical protein